MRESRMSIVVAGSTALDDIETPSGSVKNVPGGSALYFTAAASLYVPVHLISIVGDDFPLDEIGFLQQRRVNLDNFTVVNGGKTFHWGTRYEPDMNKRSTTRRELNVSEHFNPELDQNCRKTDYLFLANLEPELQMRVIEQAENPHLTALDTMECYIRDDLPGLKAVLRHVTLLFINDSEARLITGECNLIKAARAFLHMGPRYVIVKKGEHGAIAVGKDLLFTLPAYPVERVIDPTGAGDSFAGGVMGYLAETGSVNHVTLKKAIAYGGITASFCVEEFSIDALKRLTISDIEKRLDHFIDVISIV